MRSVARLAFLFAATLLGLACHTDDPAPSPAPSTTAMARVAFRPEIVAAPPGADVAGFVAKELARASADGRDLVVYVGAPWCEPCTRFHDALEHGELDSAFSTLRVVEFDHDRDEEGLRHAGYVSKLIPLFALPAPDGTSSGEQVEGSVKGDRAVVAIVPRLERLIEQGRARRR